MLTASAAASASAAGPVPNASRQLVVVTVPTWDSAEGLLRRFQRDSADGQWVAVDAPTAVTIGRAGAAWGRGLHPAQPSGPQKKEGDGRAPAGVFAIGEAFGYGERVATGLTYSPMQATQYCIDVADSPLYNRIVDTRAVGEAAIEGSTEPMRRDVHVNGDARYKLGFVIQHNPDNVAAGGSCIFAHLWKAPGEATAGCTAMAEPAMRGLLSWLQEDQWPVFVLLPDAEYARWQAAWQLPPLEEAQP
ncbi:L,D-transpeptidase [Pseudoxanthomonas sp. UTMC 1351]|uniref:L,D-transpeptidase n=1 Tax=Pseudoxanthomonas sp. UTMC 1351 TaxID=2695853 RepID=UPI0034CFF50A